MFTFDGEACSGFFLNNNNNNNNKIEKIKKRVKKQKGFSKILNRLIGALQSLGQFSTQSTQIGMNKMVQSSLFWFV